MGKFQGPEDVHEDKIKDLTHSFVMHVKLLTAYVMVLCEESVRISTSCCGLQRFFHSSHVDMKPQVNAGVGLINNIFQGSVSFSVAEHVQLAKMQ